jgi:hypothetical protein
MLIENKVPINILYTWGEIMILVHLELWIIV